MSEEPATAAGTAGSAGFGTAAAEATAAVETVRPEAVSPEIAGSAAADLDLDVVEAELDGVERALQRLADDTYWTDEVTGEPIPDEVLAADPITRRTPLGS